MASCFIIIVVVLSYMLFFSDQNPEQGKVRQLLGGGNGSSVEPELHFRHPNQTDPRVQETAPIHPIRHYTLQQDQGKPKRQKHRPQDNYDWY